METEWIDVPVVHADRAAIATWLLEQAGDQPRAVQSTSDGYRIPGWLWDQRVKGSADEDDTVGRYLIHRYSDETPAGQTPTQDQADEQTEPEVEPEAAEPETNRKKSSRKASSR